MVKIQNDSFNFNITVEQKKLHYVPNSPTYKVHNKIFNSVWKHRKKLLPGSGETDCTPASTLHEFEYILMAQDFVCFQHFLPEPRTLPANVSVDVTQPAFASPAATIATATAPPTPAPGTSGRNGTRGCSKKKCLAMEMRKRCRQHCCQQHCCLPVSKIKISWC